MEYRIVVLPGDGIGPEVSESVRRVLNGIGAAHSFSWQENDDQLPRVRNDSEYPRQHIFRRGFLLRYRR